VARNIAPSSGSHGLLSLSGTLPWNLTDQLRVSKEAKLVSAHNRLGNPIKAMRLHTLVVPSSGKE
jgi:hypothetical protein